MAGYAAPSTPASSYLDVHALLLSWKDGDPAIYNQLVELKNVFKEDYNYNVEEWAIPPENSYHALDGKLSRFLDNDGKETLLILYYGGHGSSNSDKAAVWMRYDNPDSPRLIWSSLQPKFFQRKADILIILDCCSAGSAVCEKGEGMIEGLYASGFGVKTPVSGKYAFTTNLVERLQDWCTKGVTVSHLHHDLTQNLKNSQSNNNRQQAASPHYIRPAELPGEFRTIELLRMETESFVTAPSTMAAPSIRLQPLDPGSRTEASRVSEKSPERQATEAFTASGSILEVIGQVQDYEEFDVPGNTGNKSIHFKDPETATTSDSTSIRHSVLCNYFSMQVRDVPSNLQLIDVEEMAHPLTMAVIHAANQQHNREFLANYGGGNRRLRSELREESSPSHYYSDMCTYTPLFEGNMNELIGTIEAPADTVYAGGLFHIRIHVPADYPWRPPTLAFVTKVYHPNIGPDGSICVDILKNNFEPTLQLSRLLLSLVSFLGTPEAGDPHPDSMEVASEYLKHRKMFDKTAREWTKRYATGEFTTENSTKAFQKEAGHTSPLLQGSKMP